MSQPQQAKAIFPREPATDRAGYSISVWLMAEIKVGANPCLSDRGEEIASTNSGCFA
jgi:hypothetical protein